MCLLIRLMFLRKGIVSSADCKGLKEIVRYIVCYILVLHVS